jgi:putative endonuclease
MAFLPLNPLQSRTTKQIGDAAEEQAQCYLQRQGLRLLTRNYRTPRRGGGEIDLIMCAPDSTPVFVKVRSRSNARHGGAAASISMAKRRQIVFAARYYLMRLLGLQPCRFDVVVVEPQGFEYTQGAFHAG